MMKPLGTGSEGGLGEVGDRCAGRDVCGSRGAWPVPCGSPATRGRTCASASAFAGGGPGRALER
eukprot:6390801-Alexandrium_andersonii.AAC.1